MERRISFGFPKMHLESGERRDFLPDLIGHLDEYGADVFLEHEYGLGMGLMEADYRLLAPGVKYVSNEEAYHQDIVITLRYPGDDVVSKMKAGTCLISMLHYPTRPKRVAFLKSLGLEAVSLDSLKDDVGRRLVENLRSVGWNGMNVAFETLKKIYPPPGIEDPNRNPVKVTVMGAGAVGMFAIQAAIRYGNEDNWRKMARIGATGVQVTVVDYDLTNHPIIMQQIIKYTDILVDATQRADPSKPIIPNDWIGMMRDHAVLVDLSVDPYDFTTDPPSVKGIEGVPQGNLDRYVFKPDDPVYETFPPLIKTQYRRHAVSCYSWPGLYPKECMEIYGSQLSPILRTLIETNGVQNINARGTFFHRVIHRALLSTWVSQNP
jgi:alanine dehydrogenase